MSFARNPTPLLNNPVVLRAFLDRVLDQIAGALQLNESRHPAKIELVSRSTSTQTPAGLGTALQLTFGAAADGTLGAVSIDASGNITANRDITVDVLCEANVRRHVTSSGDAEMWLRALVAGTQEGDAKACFMRNLNHGYSMKLRLFGIELASGQALTFEVIRDNAYANDGRVENRGSSHGWGNSVSCEVLVYLADDSRA